MIKLTPDELDALVHEALLLVQELPDTGERASSFMQVVAEAEVLLQELRASRPTRYPTTEEERSRALQSPAVKAARELALRCGVTLEELDSTKEK